TVEDCGVILHHRRSMFRDMGSGTADELDRMVEVTRPWLQVALADGSYRGWIAHTPDGTGVAGGGIIISPWPARPEALHFPPRTYCECFHRTPGPQARPGTAPYVIDDPVVEGTGLWFCCSACQRGGSAALRIARFPPHQRDAAVAQARADSRRCSVFTLK